jgi:hypothetical protein
VHLLYLRPAYLSTYLPNAFFVFFDFFWRFVFGRFKNTTKCIFWQKVHVENLLRNNRQNFNVNFFSSELFLIAFLGVSQAVLSEGSSQRGQFFLVLAGRPPWAMGLPRSLSLSLSLAKPALALALARSLDLRPRSGLRGSGVASGSGATPAQAKLLVCAV